MKKAALLITLVCLLLTACAPEQAEPMVYPYSGNPFDSANYADVKIVYDDGDLILYQNYVSYDELPKEDRPRLGIYELPDSLFAGDVDAIGLDSRGYLYYQKRTREQGDGSYETAIHSYSLSRRTDKTLFTLPAGYRAIKNIFPMIILDTARSVTVTSCSHACGCIR